MSPLTTQRACVAHREQKRLPHHLSSPNFLGNIQQQLAPSSSTIAKGCRWLQQYYRADGRQHKYHKPARLQSCLTFYCLTLGVPLVTTHILVAVWSFRSNLFPSYVGTYLHHQYNSTQIVYQVFFSGQFFSGRKKYVGRQEKNRVNF